MAKTDRKESEARRKESEGLSGREPGDGRGHGRREDAWDADEDAGEEQEARIDSITGGRDVDPAEALARYHTHLAQSIKLPCVLTGQEEFGWEEPFTSGEGSKREYAELKASQPSHTDEFELLELRTDVTSPWSVGGAWAGSIVAHARRLQDGQEFDLPLAELAVAGGRQRNHQLVEDYVYWFTVVYSPKVDA